MRTKLLYSAILCLPGWLSLPPRCTAQDYRPDRPPLEALADSAAAPPDMPWIGADAGQEAQAREEWDDILRTSADDAQRATDRRRRQPYADGAPRDKVRVGCICMDDFFSEATGRGACSTRGGVRFWVYTYASGDTLHWPTYRHRAHPEPLNEAELRNLASHNPDLQVNKQHKRGLWDLAYLALGSGAVLTALRLLLRRDTIHVIVHPPDKNDD